MTPRAFHGAERRRAAYCSRPGRETGGPGRLARALSEGPGIVVLAGAFDADVVDRATAAFERMIAEQRAAGTAGGDHFAKPGANDRV